jgi:O-antigen biosynthesis protein
MSSKKVKDHQQSNNDNINNSTQLTDNQPINQSQKMNDPGCNSDHRQHHVIYVTSVPFKKESDSIYPDPNKSISDNVHMVHLPLNRSDSFEDFCNQYFSHQKHDLSGQVHHKSSKHTKGQHEEDNNNKDDDDKEIQSIIHDQYRNDNNIERVSISIDQPDLVVFDRFYTEEAHSFRFHQRYPQTPLVLDMQDFHSLRIGRQNIVRQWDKIYPSLEYQQTNEAAACFSTVDPLGCLPSVMEYHPSVIVENQQPKQQQQTTQMLLRELASIQRSDLTLVCSPYEMDLLQNEYQIPNDKLCLASFFVPPESFQKQALFKPAASSSPSVAEETTDTIKANTTTSSLSNDVDGPIRFIFCGGFLHPPNADAVSILLQFIWPRIKSQLSPQDDATLHIYGAFCPSSLKVRYHHQETTNPTHVYMHGYDPNLQHVFHGGDNRNNNDKKLQQSDGSHIKSSSFALPPSAKTILLAPLRFGAGIKGKIVDAWTFGVPVVTTPIGCEGMKEEGTDRFAGRVASTMDDFVHEAINVATSKTIYATTQQEGYVALDTLFQSDRNWRHVHQRLMQLLPQDFEVTSSALQARRQSDYARAMLWHHSARSTEFMSRWIECKETHKVQ